MKKGLLAILLCIFAITVHAQQVKDSSSSDIYSKILKNYTDSLSSLKEYYEKDWTYQKNDLLTNPYYYQLFVRPTFYYNPIRQRMDLDSLHLVKPSVFGNLQDSKLLLNQSLNDFFANLYVEEPHRIVASQDKIEQQQEIRRDIPKDIEKKVELATNITPSKPITVVEPVRVISHKPNFWKITQAYGLQVMQYYFSENWYQGGDNYNSFLGTINWTANYNNQSKVTFNNSLSLQLGFQTVKGDTVHPLRSTTDQLRMVNQLAVKATKAWSYTATLTSTTRVTPQYSTNSKTPTADFMSPFETVLGIGMKYSFTKGKFNFSANMAPLSMDLKYVGRRALEKKFGMKGKHLLESYGSNITINYTWQIIKELSWTSRLYYFTNYERAQAEWENTFNFTINKYLTTKLYLYPRFDDSQYDKDGKHTIQFKQWLSLGFNISL